MNAQQHAAMASFIVFLLGTGYHFGWHRDLAARLTSFPSIAVASPPEPVLILLLGSEESVERVRQAVAPERVVAASPRAFAIEGGRIVSVDVESASDPLNAAGWGERPLEILTAERLAHTPGDGARPASAEPSLAELAQQRTLSMGEAMRLLEHLN